MNQYARVLVLFMLAGAASCRLLNFIGDNRLTPEKWSENLVKINKLLVEKEPSEEPEANMAIINKIIERAAESPYDVFARTSMGVTLRILSKMAETKDQEYPKGYTVHDKVYAMKDLGLPYNAQGPHYPMTRLERMIEHYAFEDASRYDTPSKWAMMINFDYKISGYDKVHNLLTSSLPKVKDVETLMAKVEEMRQDSNNEPSVANALDQLAALKDTLNVDTCNGQGYKILFMNDLATERQVHQSSMRPKRPTHTLFQHYAKQHEQLCRPVVPKTIETEVQKLDRGTYLSVLGLVRHLFVNHYTFSLCDEVDDYDEPSTTESPELDPETKASSWKELVAELAEKKVDGDFSTPSLRASYNAALKGCEDSRQVELGNFYHIKDHILLDYVNAKSADNQEEDRDVSMRGKFNKYLLRPCEKFLEVVGRFVQADVFGNNMNELHSHSLAVNLINGQELTYSTVKAGYYACKWIKDNRKPLRKTFPLPPGQYIE